MTLRNYSIGTTLGGITNLESLSPAVRPPKSSYKPYSQPIELGNGTVRGAGWATAAWTWNAITRAERDKLRSFCSGASAEVYIRTRTNESTDNYKYFSAVMVWPADEAKDADLRLNFVIEFRRLVEVTP